ARPIQSAGANRSEASLRVRGHVLEVQQRTAAGQLLDPSRGISATVPGPVGIQLRVEVRGIGLVVNELQGRSSGKVAKLETMIVITELDAVLAADAAGVAQQRRAGAPAALIAPPLLWNVRAHHVAD